MLALSATVVCHHHCNLVDFGSLSRFHRHALRQAEKRHPRGSHQASMSKYSDVHLHHSYHHSHVQLSGACRTMFIILNPPHCKSAGILVRPCFIKVRGPPEKQCATAGRDSAGRCTCELTLISWNTKIIKRKPNKYSVCHGARDAEVIFRMGYTEEGIRPGPPNLTVRYVL